MKRIKKQKKHINMYVVLMIMLIISGSIGYSIFNESVNITGTTKATYVISGSNLKTELVAKGTGGATYSYAGTFPTAFATFTSEELSGNTLTLTFTRTRTYWIRVSCVFKIDFKNIYPYTMGSGTRTVTTVSGGTTNVSSVSATLSKTSITAQSTATLTFNARLRTSQTKVIEIKATMTYVTQGVSQSFNYVVKIL